MPEGSIHLKLVSHHLCPYVQRAVIALTEKDVPFERINVDLSRKPEWFTAISPLGKVPLLLFHETVIFESAVILEFLEETQKHPLHPADAVRRAEHRSWIEFGSSILSEIAVFYRAKDADLLEQSRLRLKDKFGQIEARLTDGPWFDGPQFSLVDAVFGPVFRYFDTFDAIAEFSFFDGLPKTQAWRTALSHRPSVRKAVANDYEVRLVGFLKGIDSHLSGMLADLDHHATGTAS